MPDTVNDTEYLTEIYRENLMLTALFHRAI